MKNNRSFSIRFVTKRALGVALSLGIFSTPVRAADTAPSEAATASQQAREQLRQNHAAEAIDLLEKAIALEPKNARHRADLGTAISMRIGEVSGPEQGELAARMLEAFQTSVALDPNLVDGYVGLSRYYTNAPDFAGGSRKRAESYAAEIAKRVPWLGELEYGNIAFKFESFDAAQTHYAKADELNPGQAWLKELSALALLKLGRKNEAHAQLEAALKIEPARESAKKMLASLDAS